MESHLAVGHISIIVLELTQTRPKNTHNGSEMSRDRYRKRGAY